MDAPFRVVVLVDVRERTLLSALESALEKQQQQKVDVRQVPLDVGDVWITLAEEDSPAGDDATPDATPPCTTPSPSGPCVVIERKALADLAASLSDGRMYEQKARLEATVGAARVMYVIETSSGHFSFSFDDRMPARVGAVSRARLQGAVVSLLTPTVAEWAAPFGGAPVPVTAPEAENNEVTQGPEDADQETQPVVQTQQHCQRPRVAFTLDVADTAALVLRVAARVQARAAEAVATATVTATEAAGGGATTTATAVSWRYRAAACNASAVAARKGANVDPLQCFLQQLCQVPGVSKTIAAALASHLGVTNMAQLLAVLGPPQVADAAARRAVLAGAPHVGPKLSERLGQFLFGDAPPPPPQQQQPKKARRKI